MADLAQRPLARYIAALDWAPRYQRAWLRADVIGGLTAGAVVIPQAMAYATIAGMPVQVGLYTCIVPMLVYILLGGGRALSVSTTSTIATLSASTLASASLTAGSVRDLSTLVFLVGVILLLARVLRLANLVQNISDTLLTGLKTGVGLTVACAQLPKLLGIAPYSGTGHFFAQLWYALRHVGDASVVTVTFSALSIATLYTLRRRAPRVPGPLVLVVGSILLVWIGHLDEHGVQLITKVPSGLPVPGWPAFDHVSRLIPGAIAIALMAFLETVSVARAVRRRDEPLIDNNQELLAVGAATLGGSFFQAMPAAGGFSQTALSVQVGARTQVSELVTSGLAILTALFLGPVLSKLPEATLAVLVLVATLGLVSIRDFVRLYQFSRPEFAVGVLTAFLGLVSGLLVAVAVGVGATLVLVLHELNSVKVRELVRSGEGHIVPARPDSRRIPGLLVLRIGAPLYTANAQSAARQIVQRARETDRSLSIVLVDAAAAGLPSLTVLAAMGEADRELSEQGIRLWVASLSERASAMMHRAPGWAGWATGNRVWPTVSDGIDAYVAAGRLRDPSVDPLPSWRDGPTKTKLLEAISTLAPGALAVFDNDGTMWCEKPRSVLAEFLVRRWQEVANAQPYLRTRQPYRAVIERDDAWLAALVERNDSLVRWLCEAYDGTSVREFEAAVREFFDTARHPRYHVPYPQTTFAPMRELMDVLRARGVVTALTTSGGRDFVAPVGRRLYGLPRELVIGNSVVLTYPDGIVRRTGTLEEPLDDGAGKVVHVTRVFGRAPDLAIGNADGDIELLRTAGVGVLLVHDDDTREYAYSAETDELLSVAMQRGWITVSMRDDWLEVF